MPGPALNPRSFLFTLYGDYVEPLGMRSVRVSALITLAAHFGVTATALRTALSRMTAEGWLEAERAPGDRPAYRLSARGRALIEEGTRRIYERRGAWNGSWLLVWYSLGERRRRERERLRSELSFLGFGSLGNGVWVSPHDLRDRVNGLLHEHGMTEHVTVIYGALDWPTDAAELVARAWDLEEVGRRYDAFATRIHAALREDGERVRTRKLDGADAFRRRFQLTHEFRRFPFVDPDLPTALLPESWVGHRARALFLEYNHLLQAGAERYFAAVAGNGPAVSSPETPAAASR
jgi:phenylacetic acid degradation operon negative regulatory protein